VSYPDPDEKDPTPHLDAIALGFGALFLVVVAMQSPTWVHALAAFFVACWVIGWAIKFTWRLAKWLWSLRGRLELDI
jgi:hypothetical protein